MSYSRPNRLMLLGLLFVATCLAYAADKGSDANGQSDAASGKTASTEVARECRPQYDEKGNLLFPEGYRDWVFVGTSLGLKYRSDSAEETPRQTAQDAAKPPGDIHNVYITPAAYQQFVKTGAFPDQTMLVMDVYQAKTRDAKGVVSGGLFAGEQLHVEVAVKNQHRPDGSKTEWAYYAFPDPASPKPAVAFKDDDCFKCHDQHASHDRVWVQFYPTLRRRLAAADSK